MARDLNKTKVLLLVVGLVGAILTPQTATTATTRSAPEDPISWLSTGDSFSSGEGVLGNKGACAQSQNAWGPRAARTLRDDQDWPVEDIAFTACTGHLAEDFYNRRHPDRGDLWEWALEQTAPPDDRFDVITMSFGGNDIGFADVLWDCVHLPDKVTDVNGVVGVLNPIPSVGDDCDVTEDQLKQRVDDLVNPPKDCGTAVTRRSTSSYDCAIPIDDDAGTTGGIIDFWLTVADRSLAPDGRLVVVGYPALFADSSDWGALEFWRCDGVTRGDANMLGRVSDYLDKSMSDAVDDANDRLGKDQILYVSVLDGLRDHGLCSDDPWINTAITLTRQVLYVDLPSGEQIQAVELRWGGGFHPTVAAHAEEARLVARELRANPPGSRNSPPRSTTSTTSPSDTGGEFCETLAAEQARILQGMSDSQAEADALEAQGESGLAVLTSLGSIQVALGELRTYFERLDAVAPDEIADDLGIIVDAYAAADESLGGGLLAALGAMPALERINDYAVATCGRGV